MKAPEVKVCGLVRGEDARVAGDAGAAYLGAVLVPGTPRAVDPARAAELARAGGRPLVVVTANLEPARAERVAQEAGASVIQLHGEEPPEEVADLGRRGPWRIWKALRVRRAADALERAEAYAGAADGILLDAWDPARVGGTGKRFHREGAEELRLRLEALGLELVMAGGLTPENVGEAVRELQPDVVDVSSGVETEPGRKDPNRIRAFVEAARGAGDPPGPEAGRAAAGREGGR